jgi:endonuclease/exonuclease/phosphatase (EEP) superfamily protein YafD
MPSTRWIPSLCPCSARSSLRASPSASSATLLGCLAPWFSWLELINHFRPFLLTASLGLAVVTLLTRSRRTVSAALLLLTIQATLALAPLRASAVRAEPSERNLRVVTANVWVSNRNVEAVARHLEGEAADVVLLQEVGPVHRRLIDRVRAAYPHAYCPDPICDLAILSREAPLASGRVDLPPGRPLLVWARFRAGPKEVEVIGTHLANPFHPHHQARYVGWFIDYLRTRSGPLILAGDFNLTPFSWGMERLTRETGLRRHTHLAFSWPAHRYVPVVGIDNLLSTPDIATVAVRTGPRIGSDHLPVTVDLAVR